MNSFTRLGLDEQDELFPEFRVDEDNLDADELQNELAEEKDKEDEPVVLAVMAKLAELLAKETRLIREGNFEDFAELQREKGQLIRQAERLEHNRSALRAVQDIEPDALRTKLDGFNGTVEANMRAIGAVKDAITHVRSQAIKKLEDEKGDGVYSKDGEKKSLHRLSLNETQVKL